MCIYILKLIAWESRGGWFIGETLYVVIILFDFVWSSEGNNPLSFNVIQSQEPSQVAPSDTSANGMLMNSIFSTPAHMETYILSARSRYC